MILSTPSSQPGTWLTATLIWVAICVTVALGYTVRNRRSLFAGVAR